MSKIQGMLSNGRPVRVLSDPDASVVLVQEFDTEKSYSVAREELSTVYTLSLPAPPEGIIHKATPRRPQ